MLPGAMDLPGLQGPRPDEYNALNRAARGLKPVLRSPTLWLFDHLVGAGEQCRRHFEAERLSSLEVNDKLEFRRVLHRKVGRLLTLEDAIDVTGRAAIGVDCIGTVGGQATGRDKEAKGVDGG